MLRVIIIFDNLINQLKTLQITLILYVKSNNVEDTYDCLLCPKSYKFLEELMHHLNLEHRSLSPELLEESTKSRETKKQLGNYMDKCSGKSSYECPTCYEMFSSLEKLQEHGHTEHNRELAVDFIEKLKKLGSLDDDHPPICEKCNREFLGLITTRIDSKVLSVCFNCYENYYGKNMLLRVTIGTPDEMIEKLKKPL